MWISAKIIDSRKQKVVRIIENEFQAFPEGAFNPRQPDEHGLMVRDEEGVEVLQCAFFRGQLGLLGDSLRKVLEPLPPTQTTQ